MYQRRAEKLSYIVVRRRVNTLFKFLTYTRILSTAINVCLSSWNGWLPIVDFYIIFFVVTKYVLVCMCFSLVVQIKEKLRERSQNV